MKTKEDAIELSDEIKEAARLKTDYSDLRVCVRRENEQSVTGKYIELRFIIYYEEN